MNEMVHSPEYDLPFKVRESLRRISSLNMEIDGADSIQNTYPRQLPTASRDEIEAPSPQGLSAPSFQVSLSAISHPNAHPSASSMSFSGDQKRGLLVSQEELPEEEQLYQPLASADKVDHDYAQIIACPSQDHGKIPTMVGGGVQSSRRATIGSPYPVQQSTRQSSAIPHQESVMAPHVAAPRLPLNRSTGSTPVLVRVKSLASHSHTHPQCTQTHSQASVFVAPAPTVQPYQLPVSSQHSLASIPSEDPMHKSPTSARGVHKPAHQQASRLRSNHVVPVEDSGSLPHPPNEAQAQQSWYKDAEADGFPLSIQSQHEISPYATTPNCEIQPNPYQEPCGSQGSFKMVQV